MEENLKRNLLTLLKQAREKAADLKKYQGTHWCAKSQVDKDIDSLIQLTATTHEFIKAEEATDNETNKKGLYLIK